MKILVGMPSEDSWGGPIASEPPFVEALRWLGEEVTEEVYVYGDKEKPTPALMRVSRVLKTAFNFRRLLAAEKFDIIHLNTAFDLKTILRDSFSIFVMGARKSKIFLKIHGSEAERFLNSNFFVKRLIAYLGRRCDGFGVHTREEKEAFIRLGFPESKFHFVKNAVTIGRNLPNGFMRPKKAVNEKIELLFVSRFIPAKGLIETIQACAILRDADIDFILHCVGDGETRAEAEDLAASLNLSDKVEFTGYIPESEVTRYFFDCDILVFPTSHAEGFPNVLFKAVAAGMPVVTTKIRAAADYLMDGENCLFCLQDAHDVASKLTTLIGDDELWAQMSDNNRKFGETLAPEPIAKEFLAIYRELMKS